MTMFEVCTGSEARQSSVFSVLLFILLFVTRAQAVENNAGLGHTLQKMMCLLTIRRAIYLKARSRARIHESVITRYDRS